MRTATPPPPWTTTLSLRLTTSPCVADFGGFGVHAGITVPEGDAAARARLVRYCTRAPLSLERLSVTDEGMYWIVLSTTRLGIEEHTHQGWLLCASHQKTAHVLVGMVGAGTVHPLAPNRSSLLCFSSADRELHPNHD
jgi:hypothetical protein